MVSEIGYVISLDENNFENHEDYEVVYNESKSLVYFYNCLWYVIISITTIGYGDLFARCSQTRFIIFFLSISGILLFPLLISVVTNVFSYNK